MKLPIHVFLLPLCALAANGSSQAEEPLLNMKELLDTGTLKVKVLKDWHTVRGSVSTRQKLVSIAVGELLPGREYRVPVRMSVPS